MGTCGQFSREVGWAEGPLGAWSGQDAKRHRARDAGWLQGAVVRAGHLTPHPVFLPPRGGLLEFSARGLAVRAGRPSPRVRSLRVLGELLQSVQGHMASRLVEGGTSSACPWSGQYPPAQDTRAVTSLQRGVRSCHRGSGEQRDVRPGAWPIPCKPRSAGLVVQCHLLTLGAYFASSVSFFCPHG